MKLIKNTDEHVEFEVTALREILEVANIAKGTNLDIRTNALDLAVKALLAAHHKAAEERVRAVLERLKAKSTKWSNEIPDWNLLEERHIDAELAKLGEQE